MIFGGPMSANDPDDFIKTEIDWLDVPLREAKPYLGLCLGAQMLAKHLGARVWQHPEGRAEIGYYPLVPTPAGEALSELMGHALAEPCLSLASRRLRLSRRGRHPGDGRRFSDPGDSRWAKRLRPSIPPGSDPRDDLPLDRDGGRTSGDAGRAGPDPADRRTVSLRPPRGALARQVSGCMARPDAGREQDAVA